MKIITTVLLAAFFLVPTFGLCQNSNVQEMPFKIAGGKTISVKISDQGAVSAENEKIKITATAVIIGPSRESKKIPALIWSFGLKSKTNDEISKITVENVFPSDPAVLLHTDNQPKLKNGDWIGQLENGDPNGGGNAWLKTKKLSAFIFKFTVFFKGGAETTLYQLSVFSEDDKDFFLKHAEQLRIRNAN
jgi:hypothetical protein